MTGRFLKCDKPSQIRVRYKSSIYFKIKKEKEEFQRQIYNKSEVLK